MVMRGLVRKVSHNGVCNDMVAFHLRTSVAGITTWRLWSPNSSLSLAEEAPEEKGEVYQGMEVWARKLYLGTISCFR